MITATLTRPTSITPTSSCDRKLHLVETVDIGPLRPPRARTISLEPISKRGRKKKAAKLKENVSPDTTDVGSDVRSGSDITRTTGSPLPDESASHCGSLDNQVHPGSPVPSEVQSIVSTESTVSSSTGLSFKLGPAPSTRSARGSKENSSRKYVTTEKTITATIELVKSGSLPGDNLQVKISVQHTKPIKSMHGIIITLYRQGRIDSAPPLSLFASTKGKDVEKLKHEEYYPKSKTGLGGLSLISAGSSSLFRKDLSQTFAPLIVDPTTLTAHVSASVRVPEDVFPTISDVPGEMISFKYHLEIVVDLGGKLAGQQRHLPRLGTVNIQSNYSNPPGSRTDGGPNATSNMLAAWGGSIVDTDHIRREKGVVACVFEVIVGTMDSERNKARGKSTAQLNETAVSPSTLNHPIPVETYDQDYSQAPFQEQSQYHKPPYDQHYDPNYEEPYPGYYAEEGYDYNPGYEQYPEEYPPPAHSQIIVPLPEIQAEEGLSEKERARRAEERLLPSQPPIVQGSSSRANAPPSPSAPPGEEDDLYDADDLPPGTQNPFLPYGLETIPSDPAEGPSAPTLEDLGPHEAVSNPTDDKQELERQRLLAEVSAPSEFPPDDEHSGEGPSTGNHEPSAPILNDDDENYGGHYAHASSSGQRETLPRYER